MKQKNFLKIAFFLFLAIFSIKNYSQSAGDIAFIAFNADGNDEFAFVALADIPANTPIWFTDNEWDGDSFNDLNEGEVQWSSTSILTAGTIVVIQGNSGTLVSGPGTTTGSGVNLGASNETLYALLSEPLATTMPSPGFLAGISNDDAGSGGTLTGTGLTSGTNFINFADDADGYKYTGAKSGQNNFSDYLTLIMNTSNWQIETSDGTLILPIDTTAFSTGAASPGITLGAVSNNTSEDVTTATFTVVLNTQPTTDVVLNLTSGDTGEVTLDLATLTFTNGNWDTPQTVTATGVDDGVQDGSIDVTITISVNDGLSDDAYDDVDDVNTTITNEDNELTDLVVNEVLADPDATTGDANGDGAVDTSDDEFVELYNTTGSALDISGYKLSDGASERHVFPNGTVIPAGGTIVVFGGGIVSDFSSVGGLVQVASTGVLGLNNTGDTITIVNASDVLVVSEIYGVAGNDQSIARSPDFTGSFVDHSTIGTNTVDFSPGKDNTDNSPFIKTWTGATNNDWATATNWLESDVPGASNNVIIPSGRVNYPTSTAAVSINSLIVESGASLIATNTFTTTTSVTSKKTLENSSQWYFLSSPVIGETYNDDWVTANSIASGSTSATNRGVSTYDNTTNDGTTGHWRYLQGGGSGTFNVGQGYGIFLSSSTTLSFVGSGIYTASQTFGVTQGVNNYNLVGNPFTASLNLGDFFADNGSGVISGGTTWFWNGSSYTTRTSGVDGAYEIKPGEGFFVEAAANTNVTFDIADVSHQTIISFGKTKDTRPEINLSIKEGENERAARVVYINGTTKGYDVGYDGKLFGGVSHSLAVYSELLESDGKKYQLQSLPDSDYENMVVPIGVIASAGKEIVFTAEALNLPSGIKVFLEDRELSKFTRLDEVNSSYKITLGSALSGSGRFFLHTRSSALSTDDIALSGINIFATNKNTLRVTGVNNTNTSIKIYNILGKKILDTSFASKGVADVNLPNFTSGVYIVQLTTEKGKISKKIVLE